MDCLDRGIQKLWPKDVGIEIEERGPVIRFLTVWISVVGDRAIFVPHHPNIKFAFGFSPHQKTARLGRFAGENTHKYGMLKQFVVGQILSYNHILCGSTEFAEFAVKILVWDIQKLEWPESWIIKAIMALPRRHCTPFTQFCRNFARLAHLQGLAKIGNSQFVAKSLARPEFENLYINCLK